MIINYGKEFYEACVACTGAVIMGLIPFLAFEEEKTFTFLGACVIIVGCIRHVISLGRTLIMDEVGCTVRFLWYEKKYQWDDLEVKRIEDYGKNYKRRWYISDEIKSIVFAPHKIYKSGQWTPERYSMYIHPLSVFYVYLMPERELKRIEREKVQDGYLSYVVEEKTFLDKMKEWNVELEDAC